LFRVRAHSIDEERQPAKRGRPRRVTATGYQSAAYARVFEEFGRPVPLPASDGWLIERTTPDGQHQDAMGCYPLFACSDWELLARDLDELAGRLVCVSLVADPFGPASVAPLEAAFDRVAPFKDHLVTDLREAPARTLSRSTRKNLATAMKACELEVCADPLAHLEEWLALYATLTRRHDIRGLKRFSRASFQKLLALPDLMLLRASVDGETVGLHTWMLAEGRAYGHLGATSELGYRTLAAYALYWYAIEVLKDRVTWLDLGAAPGLGQGGSGLLDFKQRWATGTRPSYFCSRVYDRKRYDVLAAAENATATDYFPAYRAGEFA
jgi:hypothetical protein